MDITNWIDQKLDDIRTIRLEPLIEELGLFNPAKGIELVLRNDLYIKAIHLFSGQTKGTERFKDPIPFNLNFSMSKEDAKDVLGSPKENGGGGGGSGLYKIIPY